MKPVSVMMIAGEASGDTLAAELVPALRREITGTESSFTTDYQPLRATLEPRFFGAGGPRMAAAGVDLAFDMTAHSVIGLSDVLVKLLQFRRLFLRLFRLALDQQPDLIVCVDFSGFNRRFARAIKRHACARRGWFHSWDPKIIQYVSPQVWASREGRAARMARDFDLLLSIFPFEKEWYARRLSGFRVEFVGHPIVDRYARLAASIPSSRPVAAATPRLLLLPGSRPGELKRHLPPMLAALALLRDKFPGLRARMVLPAEDLVRQAGEFGPPQALEVRCGGLPDALMEADLALASTGTVTMECSFFRVPTVALYKTSWSTYQIGRRIVKVRYLAMPNILADEEIFPEFIQDAATPGNLAQAAATLLQDADRHERIRRRLGEIVSSLGSPGASLRAARAIAGMAPV
jgi:lipid-A-disaccharide synthase